MPIIKCQLLAGKEELSRQTLWCNREKRFVSSSGELEVRQDKEGSMEVVTLVLNKVSLEPLAVVRRTSEEIRIQQMTDL